jgi:hypothetical protein
MSAQGYVVNSMVLTIDADGTGANPAVNQECAIQGITWNTNDEQVTWQVACPDGYGAGEVKGSETLDVSYVIDYRDGSLARLLDENHGKVATIAWQPQPETAKDYWLGADVVLQRGSRTHQVGSVATATASWAVKGAGVKPIAAPTAPVVVTP